MANPQREMRDRLVAEALTKLPKWYRPRVHLALTAGTCLLAAFFSWTRIHDVRPVEWWIVPAALVFANFFEWLVHWKVLHYPRKSFLRALYMGHTMFHHRMFLRDCMRIVDKRETQLVLLAPHSLIAGLLSTVAVVAPLGLLFGGNVGWMAAMTFELYLMFYELFHLMHHLPRNHPLSKIPVLRAISRHHARHHDLKNMFKGNFNVTIPLADWVMRTVLDDEVDKRQ